MEVELEKTEVEEIIPELEAEKTEEKVENEKPKVIEIQKEDVELLETALEIRYSSLKLKELPLKVSTIKNLKDAILLKTFGITEIKVDDITLKNCQSKILEVNGRKFYEIKTREFKVGFEIELKLDGSFNPILNNYYYKIYKISNLKRFLINLDVLKKIFLGNSIELKGKLLAGKISFENRIEIMKLDLLEREIFNLKSLNKEKLLQENNLFYSLALLCLKEENKELDTWINLRINELKNIVPGDSLIMKRVHKIKGNEYDLLEIIETSPINEREIKNGKLTSYKKVSKIKIEKIPKK